MGKAFAMKPMDLVLIVSVIAFALLWWAYEFFASRDAAMVQVYEGRKLFVEAPITEDRAIRVPGPLGQSIVMISSGRVHMETSPCTNKTCIHMGRISRSGESILCIPNRVSAIIVSPRPDADAITY